jgi:8-amino-7-oxononanoate synthase
VLIGDSDASMRISARLEDAGLFVPAIRPPSVPDNGARLRVTLSAAHEESDLEHLLDSLSAAITSA